MKYFLPILLCWFGFLFGLADLVRAQSGGLQFLSDYVNTVTLGATSYHSVSFTLPISSLPIKSTDYVQVYLPSFSEITPPTSVTGSYGGGTPAFSVNGQYARVTNITVVPGNAIKIEGISTKNPNVGDGFSVIVLVSEDANANIIKNIGSVVATNAYGHISITASIDVPQARLLISGIAAPKTFVTFTEYDSVAGTSITSLAGYFGHVFSGILPTDHQITFYGVDEDNLTTSPITINIYTPAYQETSVTDQILSPTIMIDHGSYLWGEDVIATGSAVPNSNITLFTESPLRSYATTADNNGVWTYTIDNTDEYYLGDYHIRALTQFEGLTSLNSPTIGFSLDTEVATPSGEACGDITHGDLNCDSEIDLTDFSIMMYYWGTNNATADINLDNLVDITDFSIMMYYWGT